jgi:tryptophanyl-tRNA synthetase
MQKKRIFSGVQPSGTITLGNYLGAIKNMAALQDEYDCIYCVVDMHALSVPQAPALLLNNTLELLAFYIASGIDPDKSALFIQSHVPAHAELTWILNTMTYLGEINRMTQFKDKSARLDGKEINVALLDYPVLMASDILLYQADVVPVGADQKQHIELCRNLAIRFNNRFGQTFRVPEDFITKESARIMSLSDPAAKMSKSDKNANSFILFSDDKDTIIKKFKRAVTDSDNKIIAAPAAPEKAGVTNLLNIYSAIKGQSVAVSEKEFAGAGYGTFKESVGEVVAELVAPIRSRQQEILKDREFLNKVIRTGADKANEIAKKTLKDVYTKIGFLCAR